MPLLFALELVHLEIKAILLALKLCHSMTGGGGGQQIRIYPLHIGGGLILGTLNGPTSTAGVTSEPGVRIPQAKKSKQSKTFQGTDFRSW